MRSQAQFIGHAGGRHVRDGCACDGRGGSEWPQRRRPCRRGSNQHKMAVVAAADAAPSDLPAPVRWREFMMRVEAVIFAAYCNLDLLIADIRDELAPQNQSDRFAGFQAQWLNVHVDFPLLQRIALPIAVGSASMPSARSSIAVTLFSATFPSHKLFERSCELGLWHADMNTTTKSVEQPAARLKVNRSNFWQP
jgi:hypothetical protein